jgi:hypothetical protein
MRRWIVLILIALLPACASLNPSKVMQSWVGNHYSDLMMKWGPPTRSTPDGRGGQILIYEYDRDTGQIPGQAHSNPDGSVSYTAPTRTGYTAARMFWVDARGLIYSWRWKGW